MRSRSGLASPAMRARSAAHTQEAGLEEAAHAHGPLRRVGVALVELVAHWQRLIRRPG